MKKLLLALSLLSITSLFAQGGNFTSLTQQASNLGTFVNTFNGKVVAAVGVLLMSLAVVTFFAGTVRFIWSMREGDGKAAEAGKKFMLWGLLGVFVVFSIYGVIFFFQQTLGVAGVTSLSKPCTNLVDGCTTGPAAGATPTEPPVIGEGVECKANNIGASCLNGSGKCGQNAYGYVCISNNTGPASCGNGETSECSTDQDCGRGGYSCKPKYSCAGSPNVCTPPTTTSGPTSPPLTQDTSCRGKTYADPCVMPSGFTGTCQTDGNNNLVCRAQDVGIPDPLPPDQQGICFGKAEWTTCENDGVCLSLTGSGLILEDSQLVCRHGLIPLNKNDYCQPQSYTRLCNKGLKCLPRDPKGGATVQYFTCQ